MIRGCILVCHQSIRTQRDIRSLGSELLRSLFSRCLPLFPFSSLRSLMIPGNILLLFLTITNLLPSPPAEQQEGKFCSLGNKKRGIFHSHQYILLRFAGNACSTSDSLPGCEFFCSFALSRNEITLFPDPEISHGKD